MNLASSVPTSSSSVNSPIASKSPGILRASSRQVGLSGKNGGSANPSSNPDAASSSQGWQRDAQLFIITRRLVATVISTRNLWQLNDKDVQEIQKFQKIQKIQNPKGEFGHIISEYHHIRLITWRTSSRS